LVRVLANSAWSSRGRRATIPGPDAARESAVGHSERSEESALAALGWRSRRRHSQRANGVAQRLCLRFPFGASLRCGSPDHLSSLAEAWEAGFKFLSARTNK
jgi:hypothetical protein